MLGARCSKGCHIYFKLHTNLPHNLRIEVPPKLSVNSSLSQTSSESSLHPQLRVAACLLIQPERFLSPPTLCGKHGLGVHPCINPRVAKDRLGICPPTPSNSTNSILKIRIPWLMYQGDEWFGIHQEQKDNVHWARKYSVHGHTCLNFTRGSVQVKLWVRGVSHSYDAGRRWNTWLTHPFSCYLESS